MSSSDVQLTDTISGAITAPPETAADGWTNPLNMVLHCPRCGLQHVDEPEIEQIHTGDAEFPVEVVKPGGWRNPPHRSHLCHDCRLIWRPADVPTNGVRAVKTAGKADNPVSDWGKP